MSKSLWIQSAKPKKGALSRQLGIPEKENIPITLLNKIIAADPGKTIRNPTKTGKRIIKVTRLLAKRANMARNLKRISKKRAVEARTLMGASEQKRKARKETMNRFLKGAKRIWDSIEVEDYDREPFAMRSSKKHSSKMKKSSSKKKSRNKKK